MTLIEITQLAIQQIKEDQYTDTVIEAVHKVLAVNKFKTTDETYNAIITMVSDAVQPIIDDKKAYDKYVSQWGSHLYELHKIGNDIPAEMHKELIGAMATIQKIYTMKAEVMFHQ